MLIGLDYGTTTSLAISWRDGTLYEESRLLSSVYIDKHNKCLTNEDAYKHITSREGLYVHSPKSLLGENELFSDISSKIKIAPQDLITSTLTSIFKSFRLENDEDIILTLTVPNAWKDKQYIIMRDCVFKAAELVFGVRFDKQKFAIIPEPVAAALYYVINKNIYGDVDKNYVVICDVGGGTSDLAVVKCEKYKEKDGIDLSFDVVCPMAGTPGLGGDNFDKVLLKDLLPDVIPEGVSDYILWKTVKILKAKLSVQANASIPIIKMDDTPLIDKHGHPVILSCSRARFESLIREHLDTLREMLEQLKQDLLEYDSSCDLSKVILLPVGGSCRIPAVRQILFDVFRGELIDLKGEKEEAYDSIASGAAYYSAWLSNGINGYRDIEIQHRLPHRIAVQYGENALETWVEKNSPDGTYCPKSLYPIRMNKDGNTFKIGKIKLFQGDGEYVKIGKNEFLTEIEIKEDIYSHGRELNDIPVKLEVTIKSSRIEKVTLSVEQGNYNRSNFHFEQIISF